MTKLLSKAFKKAEKLPYNMQDEIATQLMEDIAGELKWDDTLKKSSEQLGNMANKAIENFRAGRTQKKGFDEL